MSDRIARPYKGKTYLVTGASAGIGDAFARALGRRGANLVLVARRKDRLDALAAELQAAYSIEAQGLSCDLADPVAVEALISDIQTRGLQIDGLINNAGYSVARPYARTDWPQQSAFIQVCVTTPARLIHAFMGGMIARGYGRILSISSIAAFSGGASGHSLYPASKSFVLKMSRSLACELRPHGIHVTAVCPGSTTSEFYQANGTAGVMQARPMPFTMTAEAVAEASLSANAAGREIVVPGLFNRLIITAMTVFDWVLTPLIRQGAKSFALKD